MNELNNILLVSGSGRNCGKTTFVCHAISQLSKSGKVIGLKISPHFHLTGNKQKLIAKGEGFQVFQETDLFSGKDSSRMLKAGASEVFFIQCNDMNLPGIWNEMKKLIPENLPVVCESGSFSNVYLSGMHVLVVENVPEKSKKSYFENVDKADFIVKKEEFSPENFGFEIHFKDSKWTLNKLKNDTIRRSA
ncbi:MAG TPA: hypothetical protein VIN10_08640 [Bacteroidales bacterium]